MKKRIFFDRRGSLVLESLLSLLLVTSCIYSLSLCATSFTKGYIKLLHKRELRAQMRHALSCIIQDLERGDVVQLQKMHNADHLIIICNDKNNVPHDYIGYHQMGLPDISARIYKNGQPLTGDNFFCYTSISFTCRPLTKMPQNKTYLLRIWGKTRLLSEPLVFETAVRCNRIASEGPTNG